VYFPDLEKEKEEIHNIIGEFVHNTLVPQIKLTNCVVDFVLVKENGTLHVRFNNRKKHNTKKTLINDCVLFSPMSSS